MVSRRMLLISSAVVIIAIVFLAYISWPYLSPNPSNTNLKRVLRNTQTLPIYVDPAIGLDRTANTAYINLYDPLIKIGDNGTVEPWLATEWAHSPDGMKYNLTIRQGVKFHDGTALTAEDVAFSMNRMLIMGTGRAYVLIPHVYSNVTALTANTVQISLKHQYGPLIPALNLWYVVNKDLVMSHIVTPGMYGDNGDFATSWFTTNAAGSGPYKIKQFIQGEKLVLEKFNDYWAGFAEKAPEIVEMIGTTEPVTVRLMMANGELEYSDPWQTLENNLKLKELPNVTLSAIMETLGNWNLMMNTKKAPLDDVHFRRALEYCMDYDKIVTDLFPGAVRCVGPVPNAMAGFDPTTPQYNFNLTKAQEELALSKYSENYTDYTIGLHWCAEVPDQEKVSMLLMTEADKIGVNIVLQKTPWTTLVSEVSTQEGAPHMAYIGADGDFLEAGSYFANRYHSNTAGTWKQNEWLLNETLDAMIDDALMTVDYDERMQKYSVIQKDIANMAPTIWLYILVAWHAYPNYVQPQWTNQNFLVKSVSSLGNVYLYYAVECEFRSFEVDKLVSYAG